jgi:hypothetical protein
MHYFGRLDQRGSDRTNGESGSIEEMFLHYASRRVRGSEREEKASVCSGRYDRLRGGVLASVRSSQTVEGPEGGRGGDVKAEALVDAEGVGVFGADVEEGFQAEARMALREVKHKGASVAFAGVGGVGADAADFVTARDAKALASHGDEFAGVVSDTEIGTHFVGFGFVEAGEGDRDEGDHFLGIGGVQFMDWRVVQGRWIGRS